MPKNKHGIMKLPIKPRIDRLSRLFTPSLYSAHTSRMLCDSFSGPDTLKSYSSWRIWVTNEPASNTRFPGQSWQSKQWVDGSCVNGSNGSVFWMGHMGHGSMHFHPWPICIFTDRKHVVKATFVVGDILVHLMHAISLPRSETCFFLKLWRLCQSC